MSKVKTIHLLLCVAFLLMIAACQKTVFIDVGQIQPRLVVNSILDKDSIISVQVSKSKSMMDSSQSIERINNATVKIFEDNILKQTLTKGLSGQYNATIKPKLASDYRLEIENTGFGHVEATALIPQSPHLISATQTTELTPGSAPQYIKFRVGLKDDGIQSDYYYLKAFFIKKGFAPGAKNKYVLACDIYSDDNVVVTDDHTLRGVIFDNAAFVGSNYELIVYTASRITQDYNLWFELSSITSDYYRYLVSAIMQNNAGNNPFAEPVVIKSNIQNGTGIFGAKNSVFLKATTF
jgi:hypothetical protein